ncbi:putative uncharacterized protein YGR160W [Phragmites australis]|uniref:putative uncharacterized protein YGR160W n=1 Tax=Phragmites australis TaxID=29695 RepID=UPI002D773298|nr:putative uncharacterized protein YGR160W [Phragmites australis]
MAANDKDLASSSLVPAPDDDYIDWDLLMVDTEEEYEIEKEIANDEVITHAVHEEELISQAEGTTEDIVSDEAIAHLLAEELEMGSDSEIDDGEEEEEDEEMCGDSDTDDDDKEEEEMGGDSDVADEDRRRRRRRCATPT